MKTGYVTRRGHARSQEILRYIKYFQKQHKFYPSIREIGAGMGINSTSLVRRYLTILEHEGYILPRPYGTARVIVLTSAGRRA